MTPSILQSLAETIFSKKTESGVLELIDCVDLNPIEQIWNLVVSKMDRKNVSSKGRKQRHL